MRVAPRTLIMITLLSGASLGFSLGACAQESLVGPQYASATPHGQIDSQLDNQANDIIWADILKKHSVQGGDMALFNYENLSASSADMKALANYIVSMSAKIPSKMNRNHAMAYWANLYNAQTILVMAENYPVSSIRKIKTGRRAGPWKRKFITVEGETLSLDNIEHDIMRPQFKTPLVHYMVNCASIGCPNLKTSPWSAGTLDTDLDKAARAYINSARGVSIDKGRLKVSSIYKWFKKDFGGNNIAIITHLKKYANADLRENLEGRTKINKYSYDWGVNAPTENTQ